MVLSWVEVVMIGKVPSEVSGPEYVASNSQWGRIDYNMTAVLSSLGDLAQPHRSHRPLSVCHGCFMSLSLWDPDPRSRSIWDAVYLTREEKADGE